MIFETCTFLIWHFVTIDRRIVKLLVLILKYANLDIWWNFFFKPFTGKDVPTSKTIFVCQVLTTWDFNRGFVHFKTDLQKPKYGKLYTKPKTLIQAMLVMLVKFGNSVYKGTSYCTFLRWFSTLCTALHYAPHHRIIHNCNAQPHINHLIGR